MSIVVTSIELRSYKLMHLHYRGKFEGSGIRDNVGNCNFNDFHSSSSPYSFAFCQTSSSTGVLFVHTMPNQFKRCTMVPGIRVWSKFSLMIKFNFQVPGLIDLILGSGTATLFGCLWERLREAECLDDNWYSYK